MASQQVTTAEELSSLPDDEILRRTLKPGSIISTTSSYAATQFRMDFPSDDPRSAEFVEIGVGLQGAVFENLESYNIAFKKEHPGNANLKTSLKNEQHIHRQVTLAFDNYDKELDINSQVHVPRLSSKPISAADSKNLTDNDKTKTFWQENLSKFPTKYQNKDLLVTMDRILPVPKITRKALINRFYPRDNGDALAPLDQNTLDSVLNHTPNKHCLIRTYLGRNRPRPSTNINTTTSKGRRRESNFSLRNFPLYLDDMESLGLNTKDLATSMGKAFAIMHWGAGVNGDDVEFVLGTSVLEEEEEEETSVPLSDVAGGKQKQKQKQLRVTRFYLLDFGQCDLYDLESVSSEDEDEVVEVEDIYQAFKGAMVTGDNQLFIPHYQKSKELFRAFKDGYITAGKAILVKRGVEHRYNVEDFMREYEEYAGDFL